MQDLKIICVHHMCWCSQVGFSKMFKGNDGLIHIFGEFVQFEQAWMVDIHEYIDKNENDALEIAPVHCGMHYWKNATVLLVWRNNK